MEAWQARLNWMESWWTEQVRQASTTWTGSRATPNRQKRERTNNPLTNPQEKESAWIEMDYQVAKIEDPEAVRNEKMTSDPPEKSSHKFLVGHPHLLRRY